MSPRYNHGIALFKTTTICKVDIKASKTYLYGYDIKIEDSDRLKEALDNLSHLINSIYECNINERMSKLIFLAQNLHEMWVKEKLDRGWFRQISGSYENRLKKKKSLYRRNSFNPETRFDRRLVAYDNLSPEYKKRITVVVETCKIIARHGSYTVRFVGLST